MASYATIACILCCVLPLYQASSENSLAMRMTSLERVFEGFKAFLSAERIKQQESLSENNRKLDALRADLLAERIQRQQNVSEYNSKLDALRANFLQQMSELTRKLRDEQARTQTLENQINELRVRFDQTGSPSTIALTTTAPTTSASTPNAAKLQSIRACLRSSNCWVQYNFKYDGNYTSCVGAQYVTQTPHLVGRYIGAVLCTSTRYKLVMADHLEDVFLNVGSRYIDRLCDLIGGPAFGLSTTNYDSLYSPTVLGFRTITSGFVKGLVGVGQQYSYASWTECRGVSIPGSSNVIQLSSATTRPATTV